MAVPTGATNGGYMVLVPPQSGATANVSALVNKDGSGNVAVPTEQYIQNASGLYVPVSSTNPLPTVLTGSSVPDAQSIPAHITDRGVPIDVFYLFNSLAITDTAMHSTVTPVTLTKYGSLVWVAQCTLNQTCTVTLLPGGYGAIADGSPLASVNTSVALLSPDTRFQFLNSALPKEMSGVLAVTNMSAAAQCSVAPTTGAVSLFVWAVKD